MHGIVLHKARVDGIDVLSQLLNLTFAEIYQSFFDVFLETDVQGKISIVDKLGISEANISLESIGLSITN